jgi:hypothetical protein
MVFGFTYYLRLRNAITFIMDISSFNPQTTNWSFKHYTHCQHLHLVNELHDQQKVTTLRVTPEEW